MNGVLTTRQVAGKLRVVPEIVRRILQRGILKGFKTRPYGHWRVKEEELAKYIERQTGTGSGHTESTEKRRIRVVP